MTDAEAAVARAAIWEAIYAYRIAPTFAEAQADHIRGLRDAIDAALDRYGDARAEAARAPLVAALRGAAIALHRNHEMWDEASFMFCPMTTCQSHRAALADQQGQEDG